MLRCWLPADSFAAIVNMTMARAGHTAAVLTNGQVLIAGGAADPFEVPQAKAGIARTELLGYLFLDHKDTQAALGKEASDSRIWPGFTTKWKIKRVLPWAKQ